MYSTFPPQKKKKTKKKKKRRRRKRKKKTKILFSKFNEKQQHIGRGKSSPNQFWISPTI
jgi:hypothetical protein